MQALDLIGKWVAASGRSLLELLERLTS